MDSIIEKARKVLALVEQVVEGEAQAAKFALEALLKKHGLTIEDLKNEKRIHPTQKPVKLYKWLLSHFAKKGDKILDTHLGSGSICIACHDLGFEMVGIEIDSDYFNDAKARLIKHQAQKTLFRL